MAQIIPQARYIDYFAFLEADVQEIISATSIFPTYNVTCKKHHVWIENVKLLDLEHIREVLNQGCPECKRDWRREHFTRNPLDPAYE